MLNSLKVSAFIALVLSIAAGCKKEDSDPVEPNDNELITTVALSITEQGTQNTSVFKWEDIDGPGGAVPVVDNILLKAGKSYDVRLDLTDASKNPPVSITSEVSEEGDVHRFYYAPSASMTISNFDLDDTGRQLGLASSWAVTGVGNGTITITLRHYPDGGKEDSDPVNSTKSSTDAEVSFVVNIEAP
jgi:hypothetical protein